MKKAKKQQPVKGEKLETELKGLQERLARALADYQNLEKHFQEELRLTKLRLKKDCFNDILEIYETVGKLNEHKPEVKEFSLLKSQFELLLKRWQVEKIVIKVGDEFDPQISQCLEVVDGQEENKVIEVVRPGYKIADFLIRPALVKVTKKLSKKEVKNESNNRN